MRLKVVLVLLLLLPGAGVLAADPQPYTVRIEPTGNAALDSILHRGTQAGIAATWRRPAHLR